MRRALDLATFRMAEHLPQLIYLGVLMTRGKFTSMLLGIIAIDDAVGIILFTLAVGLAGEASLLDKLAMAGAEVSPFTSSREASESTPEPMGRQ